ncbi:MAG TPA: SAM-dependent methyltransferase [Acidobacteriota bacterium]|nr:SAM-dependent methyltransferase [Acidobacteriota bacterium]
MPGSGSLKLVGTGVRFVRQVTQETRECLERSDRVLHLVDSSTAEWIHSLNPNSESLHSFLENEDREQGYDRMSEHILSFVRKGQRVCAAFYGHPSFFSPCSSRTISKAHKEGFAARMVPGISPQDCLFVDLGLDPGKSGIQSYDANMFLARKIQIDTSVPLILWQMDILKHEQWMALQSLLAGLYPANHILVLYEPPLSPIADARIGAVQISDLLEVEKRKPFPAIFVAPGRLAVNDMDMYDRLGMKRP